MYLLLYILTDGGPPKQNDETLSSCSVKRNASFPSQKTRPKISETEMHVFMAMAVCVCVSLCVCRGVDEGRGASVCVCMYVLMYMCVHAMYYIHYMSMRMAFLT